jgi:subtilisin family serine protease
VNQHVTQQHDDLHDLRVQITREQVARIREEFALRDVQVHTVSGRGDAAYTYAAGQILAREDKVQPVLDFLRKEVKNVRYEEPEGVIPGVVLIRFAPAAPGEAQPSALALVERYDQIDPGVIGVNGVYTVAPEAGPCPATEPEEVYFDIEPYPGVRMVDDGTDGSGARIYIADTGLLHKGALDSHPWLRGVDGAPDPLDPRPGELIQPYAAHGTFVAAVARCMAPKAHIYVSNAFQVAGSVLESDLVVDLTNALNDGYEIFNLSITTPSRGLLHSIGFDGWRNLLSQRPGVVCVVAAGNDGKHEPFYPAAYPEMVSVGALAADWRSRASFSNYGDWVKVYAPGRDLINAYATGIYECQDPPYRHQIRRFYGMAKWSGTSFSTPMVAGLIAARKSRTGQTAWDAAQSLLGDAQTQAIPHVGPILLPYDNTFKI